MTKNLIINFLLLIGISLFFTACNKKIQPPFYASGQVKLLEEVQGYYETKIGIKKDLNIEPSVYQSLHLLRLWPKSRNKSICFYRQLCLIDTNNKGYFTHSAIQERKNLFPLIKPVKYAILEMPKTYIDYPNFNKTTIYIPELNIISTQEVGETMFQKIYAYPIEYNYSITLNQLNNQPTQIYHNQIMNNFNSNYILEHYKSFNTITIRDDIYLIDKENQGFFTHSKKFEDIELFTLPKKIKYEIHRKTIFDYKEDSFKYEVLYQGKMNNKIKISFREFKNNMARPAFTQDIEYQLETDQPTIIGFKGLRIKIIKATNLDITYSVIKAYN